MKYQIFGQKSGLRVSNLALGTGNFGTVWPFGASKEDSRQVFDRFAEAGGNFIDTAAGYQGTESETFLGEFLSGQRENFVLASKYTNGGSTMLSTGNSRKTMMSSVEGSLKRLKTDHLDILWVHMSDGQTPIEEIVRGLDDLVSQGKIGYAGFSNFPAWRIASASWIAELRGWAPIIGIQVEYNLLERTAERELLPMAESLGLGVAFWSPLAGGTLTGKYRNSIDPDSRRAKAGGFLVRDEKGERETRVLDLLEKFAAETDRNVIEVALAWERLKYDETTLSTVTVIGPRNLQQLNANLSSANLSLTKSQIIELNQASDIELGSPHEIIKNSHGMIFGRNAGNIEIKHPVR